MLSDNGTLILKHVGDTSLLLVRNSYFTFGCCNKLSTLARDMFGAFIYMACLLTRCGLGNSNDVLYLEWSFT